MTSGNVVQPGAGAAQGYGSASSGHAPANLGDILERVLDKGIVIAGDIQVNLLDIELLTIKLRLVIASLDTARDVGINWWETDPWLSADAGRRANRRAAGGGRRPELEDDAGPELGDGEGQELAEENQRLQDRIRQLEAARESDDRRERAGARRRQSSGETARGRRHD